MSRNATVGLGLFAVYLVLYGGFMALSAFAPQWMSATRIGGINLAVWYGLTLIVGAFVLALVYMALVRKRFAGTGAGASRGGGVGGAEGGR